MTCVARLVACKLEASERKKLLRIRTTKRTTLVSIAVRASTAPESRPWAQRVTGHPQYAGHPHNRWTSRTAHVRAPREVCDTASAVEAQSREPASRTRPDDRQDSRSLSARLAVVVRSFRRVYDRGTSRTRADKLHGQRTKHTSTRTEKEKNNCTTRNLIDYSEKKNG